MEMEKRIPRYYKISLLGIGSVFSIYEKRKLQENQYNMEETREIPIYRLEQKMFKITSKESFYYEFYEGYQLQEGCLNACNSFRKDHFFYDEEAKLLLYTNTFIYAERKKDAYFDLVTGLEIPRYAIEQVEKVTTIDDYTQLKSNVKAIVPYTTLYQKQFKDILESCKNIKSALIRLMTKEREVIVDSSIDTIKQLMEEEIYVYTIVEEARIIPGELGNGITFEQLIDYKRQIVDSGLQDEIDFYIKKIGEKRR